MGYLPDNLLPLEDEDALLYWLQHLYHPETDIMGLLLHSVFIEIKDFHSNQVFISGAERIFLSREPFLPALV